MSPPPAVNAIDESVKRRLFDPPGPLPAFEERGAKEADGARTTDIQLAMNGEKVPAFLVEPLEGGRHPAVLALHPAPGDRSFFLKEARELARSGVVSLLIDAPWADVQAWGRDLMEPGPGRETVVSTAMGLRRVLDFLERRGNVNSSRMGFLGMSLGAMLGSILAGADRRISAFVLMSGLASFTDVAAVNIPVLEGEALDRYRGIMAPVDPVNFLGEASPAQLFIQYGRRDVFPAEALERFAGAGSQPKTVTVYDASHFLNEEARSDGVDWLIERLGSGPRVIEVKAPSK